MWFVAALCFIVDVRIDPGRTFLPGLLGHLSGDDVKMWRGRRTFWIKPNCTAENIRVNE